MPKPEAADMPTITFPYTLTIEIETAAPDVAQILLNGSTDPVTARLAENNAGIYIAEVTVVTHSGDPWDVPLVLGGDDGAKFGLSNGGIATCDLVVGSTPILAGGYAIKISAPPPS